VSEFSRPALPFERQAEAAVLRFRVMSDQEPDPTDDEAATAGIEFLKDLLDGKTTAQSGLLDNHDVANPFG
jgi:hypothetical protein